MGFAKCLVSIALIIISVSEINGHGRLMEPVHRGSAFRKGFPAPINWDDDGNFCGGLETQHDQNNGKCGVCGDDYAEKQPRPNENGGTYGTGIIVKTYKAGSIITAWVELTANHLGYFKFALCPLNDKHDLETEECFDAHKLEFVNGGYKHPATPEKRKHVDYFVQLRLPQNFTCKHCVLRWEYITGNNWGMCEDRIQRTGCGRQETFRTCSDIKIE